MPWNWLKRNTKIHDEARAPLSKFGFYGLVTLVCLLVAAGMYLGAQAAGEKAGRVAVRTAADIVSVQLAKGCGRTQIQRGYLWLRAREFTTGTAGDKSITTRLAPHLFKILWCEKTYAVGYDGPAVYLPDELQECFLSLERDGYFNEREAVTDAPQLRRLCANT